MIFISTSLMFADKKLLQRAAFYRSFFVLSVLKNPKYRKRHL
ncbi:hypothetical protein HMPREF9554_01934 [Treponema phagedenis F0421]|nr:hypothetical protein HMPREF9554_01934 [Treponema phagedenis F0421]